MIGDFQDKVIRRHYNYLFALFFFLESLALGEPAAILRGHSYNPLERSVWQGTKPPVNNHLRVSS